MCLEWTRTILQYMYIYVDQIHFFPSDLAEVIYVLHHFNFYLMIMADVV